MIDPYSPYVYGARVHRVIDGDSIKLHLDHGFGHWHLATVAPGVDKEARYPQGVYRLSGIDTPEKHGATKAAGLRATARVNELISMGRDGDSVLVKSNKEKLHGKFRYMLDLYVPTEPKPLPFETEEEEEHWVSDADLESLISQAGPGSTVRAMATELLARRQPENSVIHVNQQLITEGLAVPYFGGKKKS